MRFTTLLFHRNDAALPVSAWRDHEMVKRGSVLSEGLGAGAAVNRPEIVSLAEVLIHDAAGELC